MSDLFNLSEQAMNALSIKANNLAGQSLDAVGTVSYGCICCGGGSCAVGIAGD